MTELEIERSRINSRVLRYWLRGLVRSGTPSRLGLYCGGTLLWNCAMNTAHYPQPAGSKRQKYEPGGAANA